MRRTAALAVLLLLAACGGSGTTDEPAGDAVATDPTTQESAEPGRSPSPSPTTQTPLPAEGTVLVVEESDFGPILFDERGQAIYLFDVEESPRPECYGACAEAWPPVLTDGEPVAGSGARPRLLATTERRDGSVQVTYAGHPLYYYAHEAPGEVKCHDVFLNGGTWYAVAATGTPAP